MSLRSMSVRNIVSTRSRSLAANALGLGARAELGRIRRLALCPRAPVSSRRFVTAPSRADRTSREQEQEEPEREREPEVEGEGSQPLSERLKALLKKYGRHAVVVYFALSTVDFSLVFCVVHLLGADQIGKVQDGVVNYYREWRYGVDEARAMADRSEREKIQEERDEAQAFKDLSREEQKALKKQEASAPWYRNKLLWTEIALAYGIHKTALLPVRAGLTIAWTPKLVAWLTRRGWIGKVGRIAAGSNSTDRTGRSLASGCARVG